MTHIIGADQPIRWQKLYLEFGGKMLEDFHAARVPTWIRTRQ